MQASSEHTTLTWTLRGRVRSRVMVRIRVRGIGTSACKPPVSTRPSPGHSEGAASPAG